MQSYPKTPFEQAITNSTEILGRLYEQAVHRTCTDLFSHLRHLFTNYPELTWPAILDRAKAEFGIDRPLLSPLDIKHWQPDFKTPLPPEGVLYFLGEYIKECTGGELVSEVTNRSLSVNQLTISFLLVVSSVGLKQELFQLSGNEYPAKLTTEKGWLLPAANTTELVDHLRSILIHEQTQQLLGSLLSQIIQQRIQKTILFSYKLIKH